MDLGDAIAINLMVMEFRRSLSTPYTDPEAPAKELYKTIIAPILPLIQDKNQLLVSPDSQLNLMPFDALVDGQGQYLVETYQTSYLTSGRDLLKLKLNNESEQAPVILGDPDYDNGDVSAPVTNIVVAQENSTAEHDSARVGDTIEFRPFKALPATRAESEAIAQRFPHATLLSDREATETALKQVQSPRILHLATHGFFLSDPPFEPPTTPQEVQAIASLNALEATGLNLHGTQLVVLSACETGIGEATAGKGVYGLRRAFVIAGAQSQLTSLWRVGDAGTSELMQGYYNNLQAGQGRDQALQTAQLGMLEDEEYAHPYFWSSIVLSGDWRSLEGM